MNRIQCCINKSHYAIDHVKQLPCGNLGCYECLKQEINAQYSLNAGFICTACNEQHKIRSENDLKDFDIEQVLIPNKTEILNEFSKNLEKCLKKVEDSCNDREKLADNYLEFIKEDILIRIESLKAEIDSMGNEFLNKLDAFRQKIDRRLDSLSNYVTENRKNWSLLLNKLKDQNTVDESNIKDNVKTCQTYINDLQQINSDLYSILRSVSFKPSEKLPNDSYLGKFVKPVFVDFVKLKSLKAEKFNLIGRKSEPTSICELDSNRYVVTNVRQSVIHIVTKDFDLLETVVDIDKNVTFANPIGICVNPLNRHVYICDTGNNRIVVTDDKLQTVVKVFGERGTTSDSTPRVQIFSPDMEFISEIVLNRSNDRSIDYAFRMCINEDLLAVVDFEDTIYMYKHNGTFVGSIAQKHVNTIQFIGLYLFTHSSDGSVCAYEINSTEDGKFEFKSVFNHVFSNFKTFSFFMEYFNGKLMISFTNKKCIMAFKLEEFI